MSADQQAQLLARVEARLARGAWEEQRLAERLDASVVGGIAPATVATDAAAAEVAAFALGLCGKRPAARRARKDDNRLRRMILNMAVAAMLALSTIASSACGVLDSGDSTEQTTNVDELSTVSGSEAVLTRAARGTPAQFDNLLLLDPGSDTQPWAVLLPLDWADKPTDASTAPVLIDRDGAGLDQVGGVYRVAARAVAVESRTGPTQFLDPLVPATYQSSGRDAARAAALKDQLLVGRWADDARFTAVGRAVAGTPSVLDAAYNAAAAYAAGGTHTFADAAVLRVDPQNPVLEVVDRGLLESGTPVRAEDVVFVAIRQADRGLYEPGQVATLRNVIVERYALSQGASDDAYILNAALDGSRVEPTTTLDLPRLLSQRLQRTDADLSVQAQELAGTEGGDPLAPQPTPVPSATSTPGQVVQNTTIVERRYGGPSFIDDYLMWRWLTSPGYYGGRTVIINNPPASATRPTGSYYYTPPSAPSASQAGPGGAATSRSSALQSARNAVSGQAAGTGGGTAATAKSAAVNSDRVNAATAKSAALAGQSSASSIGKSTASVAPPAASGSTASRSAGVTSSASKGSGSVGGSSSGFSSSGSKGIGGASSS